MKTLSEFWKDKMEKEAAVSLAAVPALATIPLSAGILAGKLYSDATSPAEGKYESFEADLLKKELQDRLRERERQKRLKAYKEVLRGTQRSIRI